MMQLIPTILCGGAGSRLWPVSRESHPKPFIQVDNGQSLLQKTFLRSAALPYIEEILIVTNHQFFFKIEEELIPIKKSPIKNSFILEPFPRNTAAAITLAAMDITERYDEDTLLLILPADHLIPDQDAFQQMVSEGSELALTDRLVTFGMMPTEPHTGYGYLEVSGAQVLRFIEKPSLENAQALLEKKNVLWNSGMFLFKASTLLTAMKAHNPEILAACVTCFDRTSSLCEENSNIPNKKLALDAETFEKIPADSIDYALMEKAENLAVVPAQFNWTDIGSWNAVGSLGDPDASGNCVAGDVLLHDVHDSFIQSEDRLIAAVGVNNLVIIDTPDALLVADKTRTQDVKHIYTQLQQKNHDAHKFHRTVHRPWGSYTVLEESENFKIKRIVVKPGASLSLQMHHHRSEHWVVVKGRAHVINGDQSFFLNINESTYIPAGHKHRLENPGMLDLMLIEVQSGEYLGEDDIVRYEDHYGRK